MVGAGAFDGAEDACDEFLLDRLPARPSTEDQLVARQQAPDRLRRDDHRREDLGYGRRAVGGVGVGQRPRCALNVLAPAPAVDLWRAER
jgi:hypothetical protein